MNEIVPDLTFLLWGRLNHRSSARVLQARDHGTQLELRKSRPQGLSQKRSRSVGRRSVAKSRPYAGDEEDAGGVGALQIWKLTDACIYGAKPMLEATIQTFRLTLVLPVIAGVGAFGPPTLWACPLPWEETELSPAWSLLSAWSVKDLALCSAYEYRTT
jgi:hypothetical protein